MSTRLGARAVAIPPLFGLALMVASCGGGGNPGDRGTGWLAGEGKPVDLALTFDVENGEAKVITPRGGRISTTGADGTRYQLEIPEGALLTDERISLIPVASVKNLPLKGGSIAAVHLKPEGLRLLKPATLRIRAPIEVPVAEQVGFAYFENGKDAHLYPILADPTRIELPIFHFSGYGFGKAPLNDPGRLALQQAAAKEARLHAKIAEILARERAKHVDPESGLELQTDEKSSTDWQSETQPLGIQYLKEVLLPLMKIAETDERMYECAITRYLGWERQKAVLGCAEEGAEAAAALGGVAPLNKPGSGSSELQRLEYELAVSAAKIHENRIKKMFQPLVKRCREEHDMRAAAELHFLMLATHRQMALLGIDNSPALERAYEEAKEDMKKCLSFELEFRSVIETKTAEGDVAQHYHVHAQVPISADDIAGEAVVVRGSAPLKYVGFSFSSISANRKIRLSGIGTRESALTVSHLIFNKTREKMKQTNCAGQDEWQERFVADSVQVLLSPGKPVELVRGTGPGFSDVTESTGWLRFWNLFRQAEKEVASDPESAFSDAEASDRYILKLRQESPGTYRVDFEWAKRDSGLELEDSYVVLRHTPK